MAYQGTSKLMPIFKSHQEPNLICLTHKVANKKNFRLKRESIVFDVKELYKFGGALNFYIHQRGELIDKLSIL